MKVKTYLGILAAVAVWQTFAVAESVEWTFALEAPAAPPTLYPNEAAPLGVAVTAGNTVAVLKGDGTLLWQAVESDSIATPATVADIDGDTAAETLLALANGTVICLDSGGAERWRYAFNTPAGGFKALVAADLTPSRGMEILAGFDDGWLNCLSADGRLLWRFFGDRYRVGGIAVGCTDGDNVPEIIYGTDNGNVYELDSFGRVQWRHTEHAPYGRSGPNLARLHPDGNPEVFITRSNVGNATCLMALGAADGTCVWRSSDTMQGYCSTAFADVDGDGVLEVLHGDKGNYFYCENADGNRRWHVELGGRGIFWAPAMADIDGDGRIEAILGIRGADPATGACVYLVGPEGNVKQGLKLGGDANATPAVGDIDGDGELEVVCAISGPNQIQALTWHAKGTVAWPSLRGNSRMTGNANLPPGEASESGAGSAPHASADEGDTGGMAIETGEPVWGANTWTLSWKDPVPEGSFVEVIEHYIGGTEESRVVDLKPNVTQAAVPVRLYRPEAAQVVVHLHTASSGEPTAVVRREVMPNAPGFCRIEEVHRACEEAIAAGKAVQADTEPLETRLAFVRAHIADIHALDVSQTPAQTLIDRAERLRADARGLEAEASMLAVLWRANGAGAFVWWVDENPWDTFEPLAMPETAEMSKPIVIQAYQDEFEDAALTLRSISSAMLDVRATFTAPDTKGMTHLEPPLSAHVTLRRVVPVGAALQERVYDALPELDSSRTITLPPGEARQLWITVDTHGLEAGTYELTLYLGSLEKPSSIREVPLRIEVWPVRLPENVFAKMNWCSFNEKETSDDAARDLIQHGVSAAYGPPLPSIPVNAGGNASTAVDWKAFDKTMQRIPKYFTLLWGGPPSCIWPEGVAPKEDDEAAFVAFRTGIALLVQHMEELGFPYRQWAFYPIDEPWNTGLTNVPALKRFCERVKRADPKAQVYADPAGMVRTEYLDEFKDLIDIWQPEMNLLKRDPQLVEWFQKNAKRFWTYEAPGPAKDLPPLGHYRAFAWMAWNFGCEGVGYWLYHGEDNWWTFVNPDYSAVYQTNGRTTPSRRWEADRDGVEDYRALFLLREAAGKARADGRQAEADKAQALMEEAVRELVGWQMANIDEITRFTKDYELDFTKLTDYRGRIAAAIVELRKGE